MSDFDKGDLLWLKNVADGALDNLLSVGRAERTLLRIAELEAENAQQEKRWRLGRIVCEECRQVWYDDGINPLDCPYCRNTRLHQDLENQLILIARAEAAEAKLRAVKELVEKWRRENPVKGWADDKSDEAYDAGCCDGARLCADELEALLKEEGTL